MQNALFCNVNAGTEAAVQTKLTCKPFGIFPVRQSGPGLSATNESGEKLTISQPGGASNFRTLVIAGLGAIGSSLIKLSGAELRAFEQTIAVDRFAEPPPYVKEAGISYYSGDVHDRAFLASLLGDIPLPALFVNLCANVDNVLIRKTVSRFDAAYIDSCACIKKGVSEHRFSRMMPYTLTPFESRYPHWLCWGINPGIVEIITRKLIENFPDPGGFYDVSIYEYDQLHDTGDNQTVPVGWCPDALIEEVMLSPTLVIHDGEPVEGRRPGADSITALWKGKEIASRVVAHEDIWNIGTINGVRNARFIYALHPRVMRILAGDPDDAAALLQVPPTDIPVFGSEQVAVAVKGRSSRHKRSLVWRVDHHAIWQRFGVNGVQYQTAKSILLAILLLQHTRYGTLAGTYCAADLPITGEDWPRIDSMMETLGILWEDAAHLDLQTEQCA